MCFITLSDRAFLYAGKALHSRPRMCEMDGSAAMSQERVILMLALNNVKNSCGGNVAVPSLVAAAQKG